MAYTSKTWVTGEVIQAVDLNHAEQGIATAQSGVDAISANGAIGTANLADGAVTLAKLADAVKSHFALADDVSELKSAVGNLNHGQILENGYALTPYATVNGWKLTNTGVSATDANYKLLKFAVIAGVDIYVWCFDGTAKLQFQIDASVPSDSNPYIVGDAISDGYCGKLSVPIGARYIIISTNSSDSLTGVYFNEQRLDEITDDAITYQLQSKLTRGEYYIDPKLEQGGLNEGIGGAITSATNRLRTSEFLYSINSKLVVELPANFQWFILEFDETYKQRQTSQSWITGNTWTLSFPYFKIVLRKSDNSDITVADATTFKLYAKIPDPLKALPFSTFEQVIPNAVADGWKLNSSGNSVADADYKLMKFAITGLSEVYINSQHIYQFQNSVYVPSAGNSYIVGDVVQGTVYEKVSVPAAATYLIMSAPLNNQYLGLYANKIYEPNHNQTMAVSPILAAERYIGHRGGGKTAPENTIPSCQQGYDNGFRIVEIDIQFTSDNVPVALHDTTINRTARNADGTTISSTINIGDITYSDAQEYDFGVWKDAEYTGTKIPSLDDVLLWAKKNGCCVECDLYGTENMTAEKAAILYNLITKRGMNGAVMFTGSYVTTLNLFDGHNDICVCCSSVGQTESYAQEASTFLQKSLYTMCSVQYPYLTDDQVGYVHNHGMAAKGFTVTSAAEADAVWAFGVDKMILDGVYPNEV